MKTNYIIKKIYLSVLGINQKAGTMPHRTKDPDRGVSEVVGVVILIGLVVAGTALVVVSTTVVTDRAQQQNRVQVTQQAMMEFETRVRSAVETDGAGTAEFDVSRASRGTTRVLSGDTLTVRLDGTSECATTVPMDRIRHELPGGEAFTYQAGGVWRDGPDGASMVSPPEVEYDGGALTISTVDVVGNGAGDGDFTVRHRPEESAAATGAARESLMGNESCRRPDVVTLLVHSQGYHRQWYDYLRSEFPAGATVSHHPAAGLVNVTLDRSVLPSYVNDSENHVVDFTEDEDLGRLDDVDGDGTRELVVDKGVGNRYDATVSLIDANVADRERTWRTETVWNNTTVTDGSTTDRRPPIEVVLVLDQSGSMEEPPAKIRAARAGATEFVGWLLENDSVAVASFATDFHLRRELTTDHGAATDAIATIPADGDTYIANSIEGATEHLREEGNDSRRQAIVFLSDGNPDDRRAGIIDEVDDAEDEGIEVHTIAFGDDAAEGLLQDMAREGNGTFQDADETGDLEDAFRAVAMNVSGYLEINESRRLTYPDRRIVHEPVQLTVTIGGDGATPWSGEAGGASGLNFPYPDRDAYVTRVDDGEPIDLERVAVHDCTDGVRTDYLVEPPWDVDDLSELSGLAPGTAVFPPGAPGASPPPSSPPGGSGGSVPVPGSGTAPDPEGAEPPSWADDPGVGRSIPGGEPGETPAGVTDPGPGAASPSGLPDGVDWGTVPGDVVSVVSPRTGSLTYAHTRCTSAGPVDRTSGDVHYYGDGDPLPPASVRSTVWYQRNLTEAVPSRYLNDTDGDGTPEQFDLETNQVIGVFRLTEDGVTDANDVVVLVEVGASRSEAQSDWLINVDVERVEVEDE